MRLAYEIGVLSRPVAFEEYVDDSFSRAAEELEWDFERLARPPGERGTGGSQ